MSGASRPAFLADAMLGDVARWLRILGEDCLYADPDWSDDIVLERARPEDRVLVTRDVRLAARAEKVALRVVLVRQEALEDLLVQVYQAVRLVPDPAREATRCSLCNGLLVTTDAAGAEARARAMGRAPPRPEVRRRHAVFWSCSVCGQPFWRGTHWENIEATRERIVRRAAAR